MKLGRTLSPAEAISNPTLEIDAVHRILFQKWVAEVFRRFDAVKSYLVPDEYAETIQPQPDARAGKTRRAGCWHQPRKYPMSTAFTFDPLGSNMEEVIAALPTQQERDEFTLFIEEHLKRGTGAGILRGMFLLLKANRCYLEKLPGQFNRELVQPIRDHALRMEEKLSRTDRCAKTDCDSK